MRVLPELSSFGPMRDLKNLDLMRTLAVLLVAFSHVLFYTGHLVLGGTSFWCCGFLGVALFFVHTTLVLMWSLARDPHTTRFYIRRAFRIYPLWIVVLLLSILVRLPTSPIYAPAFRFYQAGFYELAQNVALIFNLGVGDHIIGASWSLPVEVQMYVLLPFLFFFLRANRTVWPLLLLDALAILTSRHLESPLSTSLLFCTPLFLPGAMAYVRFQQVKPRIPAWTFPLWLLGVVAAFNFWASRAQNSLRSGWLFAIMVGLSLPLFRQISWPPLVRATHLVARYSYGVYLCHFAAIAVGVHYLQTRNLAVRLAAFACTIVVLPVFFYHAVEQPMIVLGSRVARRFESGPEPRMDEQNLSLEPAP